MSYAEAILPEFDQETANTRKVLESIPTEKWDFKPHPKSNTIGWNANHLAELPGWVEGVLKQTSWDIAPVDGEPYQMPEFKTPEEVLEHFDKNVASAHKAIQDAKAEDAGMMWSLLQGGNVLFTMPRGAVIRTFVLNHMIHHRAILCVYLRLNDIPVPGMYGPSGDETGD